MKRYSELILFFIISIFAIPCLAQKPQNKPCDLSLKDAPALRGLKLDMSEEEVLIFFNVKKKDLFEPLDVLSGSNLEVDKVSPSAYARFDSFKDVGKLNLGFFDGKLYQISLSYSFNTVQFGDASQFAKTLSDKFNLPFSAWKYSDRLTGVLGCKEFGLYVEAASNKITLTDLIVQKAIIDRNEQKRKNFKP